MSSFEVKTRLLTVEPHPNADRLDIVRVDGYTCVAQKDRFTTGQVGIYVPTDAVVPDKVLQVSGFWKPCEACSGAGELENAPVDGVEIPNAVCLDCKGRGGTGMLAGSKGNRVKPVRLRDVLSEGILLDLTILDSPDGTVKWGNNSEGIEVGGLLGIVKYEAPIPVHLAGDVKNCPGPMRGYTDIENIKKFPGVLVEGEEVVATEKAHGSCMIVLLHDDEFYIASKGFAGKGQYLVDTRDEKDRPTNAYWRAFYRASLDEKLRLAAKNAGVDTLMLFGEILGVQDLKYGMENGDVRFVAFDAQIGETPDYLDWTTFTSFCYTYRIPQVPALYEGPYSEEAIAEVTDGHETLTGEGSHIREGVIVQPVKERVDPTLGRVILKSVSGDYLTRRGGTEFN